jgi:hypothetical protein
LSILLARLILWALSTFVNVVQHLGKAIAQTSSGAVRFDTVRADVAVREAAGPGARPGRFIPQG